MWAMTLLCFEGNCILHNIWQGVLSSSLYYGSLDIRQHLSIYFACWPCKGQGFLLVHDPGAKICALFINLSCHHRRYCPAVDHKSVLPTGQAQEHSCESNLTPTDA